MVLDMGRDELMISTILLLMLAAFSSVRGKTVLSLRQLKRNPMRDWHQAEPLR